MLADEILAHASLSEYLGPGASRLRAEIKRAHRFDLTEDFAVAADELGASRPSAFLSAISLCRPPYAPTWIETSQSYRPRFCLEADAVRPRIRRIGLLLEPMPDVADHQVWGATLCWSFPNGDVNVAKVAWVFDARNGEAFPELQQSFDREAFVEGYKRAGDKWSSSEREARATIEISFRGRQPESPYSADLFQALRRRGQADAVGRIIQASHGDWASEHPFWLGALALLNSRNASVVDERERDLTKLNRARRRQGKPEMLSFRTVRISPRIVARTAVAGSGTDGLRAHFVRGHFKVRKSGIFWWSPFLRGDARQGLVMKDYRVEGGLAHTPAPARGSV